MPMMPNSWKVSSLALCLALAMAGCVGGKGPSNVSQGKLYASGNAEYDEFFGEVYQLQVSLGKAPDREREIRQKLAEALSLDPSSRAEEIAAAVSKRVGHLGKPGTLKVITSGLEPKGTPSAVLTTTGTLSDPKEKPTVDAIDQAIKDTAILLADTRRSTAATEHLRARGPELEPGVDEKFRLEGPSKKSEVAKNLGDAERMVPLMSSRAGEMEERTLELLKKLEKAVNSPATEIVPEKVNLEPETGKKGKDKPKAGHGEPKPAGHGESKPAARTAPKPAEPKPAGGSEEAEPPKKAPPKPAAPTEDFEP